MPPTGIINLHGREYKTVALRVAEFRAAHPIDKGWCIRAHIEHIDETSVIVRACVVSPEGVEVAVDYAEERRSSRGVNSTSALENCSTSAIGRALAAAGLGGSEYASADELANAITQQNERRAVRAAPAAQKVAPARAPAAPAARAPAPAAAEPTKHDPSFTLDSQRFFMAKIGNAGIEYEALATYCAGRGWGRPSSWDAGGRKMLLDEIADGKWARWIAANPRTS